MNSMISCAFVTDSKGHVMQLNKEFGVSAVVFPKFIHAWKVKRKLRTSPKTWFHPLGATAAFVHFYKSARSTSKLDKLAPLSLWEHHIRLLPSGEVYEHKQVVAVIEKGGIPVLPPPDLGLGNLVPGVDDEIIQQVQQRTEPVTSHDFLIAEREANARAELAEIQAEMREKYEAKHAEAQRKARENLELRKQELLSKSLMNKERESQVVEDNQQEIGEN